MLAPCILTIGTRVGPVYVLRTNQTEIIEKALKINGAHIHIYGKATTNMSRKMGHVTALGSSIDEAESLANAAASLIHFGEQK